MNNFEVCKLHANASTKYFFGSSKRVPGPAYRGYSLKEEFWKEIRDMKHNSLSFVYENYRRRRFEDPEI